MSNYSTIRSLGLRIHYILGEAAVNADALEMILNSGSVVYGYGGQWSGESSSNDTHTALVVNVRPIAKSKKDAVTAFLHEIMNNDKYSVAEQEKARSILRMED